MYQRQRFFFTINHKLRTSSSVCTRLSKLRISKSMAKCNDHGVTRGGKATKGFVSTSKGGSKNEESAAAGAGAGEPEPEPEVQEEDVEASSSSCTRSDK